MTNVKSGAMKYIGKLMFQRFLGAAIFFISAGTLNVPRALIYFFVYTALSAIVLYHHDPELLNARRKIAANTEAWDKILLLIYVLLGFYGVYAAAGLSIRFQQTETSLMLFGAGMLLMILTCFLSIWPVMENRNFESSVRIQEDRGQTVCSSGPYSYVRHPGYSAILLWSISISMIFGGLAGIIAILIILTIVIRTYFEDQMLQEKLSGYVEYSKKVKYRLIPYIW